MRIINLINIIKETLKNKGIEFTGGEIYFDEFMKVNSDEYENILYKKESIKNDKKLDIGIGNIIINNNEKYKIYAVCGNESKILYNISIGSIDDIKVSIDINKMF